MLKWFVCIGGMLLGICMLALGDGWEIQGVLWLVISAYGTTVPS